MKSIIPKPEKTFFRSNISSQVFPFPDPIMNYIKKNPTTPKLCINLLESCKYFYSKGDLLIPLNGHIFDKYCRYKIGNIIRSQKKPMKYQLPFKVWLTGCLNLGGFYIEEYKKYFFDDFYFFKTALRCTLKQLSLKSQRITLKEFQFLNTNNLKRFVCCHTTILFSDDTVVPIETIFEYLKNNKEMYYIFGKETATLVTSETAKKLAEAIDTSALEIFRLQLAPSTFDFEIFKEFTETHSNILFDIHD